MFKPISSSLPPSSWVLVVLSILGCATAFTLHQQQKKKLAAAAGYDNKDSVSLAFCGNSMLYFNDCPRLIQQMVETIVDNNKSFIRQNSCLRGGATLSSLWDKGNGMSTKFATQQATVLSSSSSSSSLSLTTRITSKSSNTPQYDIGAATVHELLLKDQHAAAARKLFVVMNDHTQGPARTVSRNKTLSKLQKHYIPLLEQVAQQQQQRNNPGSSEMIVVLIQTPAYRVPGIRETDDLGDFERMSNLLATGVSVYAETIQNAGVDCRVAPVGEAFRYLYRQNKELWKKLYSWDNFHPSPYGTWLQACVVYVTCFGTPPPEYNALWWERSRYMQPPDQKPLPLPSEQEAMELHRVACMVCGLTAMPEEGYPLDPLPPQTPPSF